MTKAKAEIIVDRGIEYLLYIMIAFIPISKSGIEISFSLTLLLFLIKKALKPEFGFIKDFLHLFLFLFFGFCALSLFNSGLYIVRSAGALFFKWLEYIFIFIILEDTLSSPKRLRNAVFILLAMSGLIGIDGLIQRFTGIDFLRQRPLLGTQVTATFQNQNDFSAYLMLILLLSISLAFSARLKRRYRWTLFFLIILLDICLILTFSRGAWLGFFSGLVLMSFLSYNIKKIVPFICILIVVLMLLVPPVKQRVVYTFLPGGDGLRFSIWPVAWAMIKENPYLGKGIGIFMEYYSMHKIPKDNIIYYAHNCFLQIWAESGIFGLLTFLGFLNLLLLKAIKAFRKNQDFLILGVLSGIFGFLVHSFFDTQFYSLQLAVLFWATAGILSAMAKVSAVPPLN